MNPLFYTTAAIGLAAALLAITRREALHGILYLIVVLIAMAILFFSLGAPFVAALEIIVYAGAIIVLFLFVVMMINPPASSRGAILRGWFPPLLLTGILALQFATLLRANTQDLAPQTVGVDALSQAVFGEYVYTLHLVAVFLLVGLVGAFHLTNGKKPS